MSELNRDQIIKAIRCFSMEKEWREPCDGCWFHDKKLDCDQDNMCYEVGSLALALIKELTEENERLKAPRYWLHSDGRIENLTNDIITVKMGGRNYGKIHALSLAFEKEVRADTVRKMQERLKEYYRVDTDSGLYCILDKIAKEMLEDGI